MPESERDARGDRRFVAAEGAGRERAALFHGKHGRRSRDQRREKEKKKKRSSDMWQFFAAAADVDDRPFARAGSPIIHPTREISLINPSFSKKPQPPPPSCVAAIWNRDWTLNGAEKKRFSRS